jgi:hypothetical protein
VAWYAALFGTMALDGVFRKFLYPCPPDLVVSGLCGADWYGASVDATICFGAGLAAFLIVTGCAAMAPTHKKIVALVTFLSGAGVALYAGLSTQAYDAMVTAVLVGAVTTSLKRKR